jgi:peptide/nickel transport system permease protein
MSSATQALVTPEPRRATGTRRDSARSTLGYLRRNPSLGIGLLLLLTLVLFIVIGHLTVDTIQFRPLSTRPLQPPSWELPFGSDKQGRNLYAVMVEGTPLTLRIGLLAGVIGVTLGATLAFIAGYYGGWIDNVIRIIVDVGLTIPGLLILIIIAMRVRGGLSVDQMALVVGLLAWLYPARTIRSQVLTLKQRGFVQVARLSGMSSPEVIAKELLSKYSVSVRLRRRHWG